MNTIRTQSKMGVLKTGFCLITLSIVNPLWPSEVLQFRIATLDGKVFDLNQKRGKWVVVNYWATWCSPCIKELTEFSDFQKQRSDVEIIGLAFENTPRREIDTFLSTHKVSFAIAHVDPTAPPKAFKVPLGLPTTYLISPEGLLVRQWLGPLQLQDLEKTIGAKSSVVNE
jgi:thiol-disulfide isomerase/thioredoxin